jgi:hypothetical protein
VKTIYYTASTTPPHAWGGVTIAATILFTAVEEPSRHGGSESTLSKSDIN